MEENKNDSTGSNTNQANENTTQQNPENANRQNQGNTGNAKTIAILCYITFIGWIIAIVMQGNENPKTSLAGFH